MSELEALQAELAELRAEYARVGKPLLNQIISLSGQVRDIKRERGELFYVDYMQYHRKYEEECDDLEEASSYAQALSDSGSGYVMGIHGPGVALGENDWDEDNDMHDDTQGEK